jgi:hypothetical protein
LVISSANHEPLDDIEDSQGTYTYWSGNSVANEKSEYHSECVQLHLGELLIWTLIMVMRKS